MNDKITFEEIFEQNERRIHYHLQKLNIHDPYNEFYQEGLCAMWNAYETYQPDKGPMSTYFNYMIRNRLIDLMRQQNRQKESDKYAFQEQITELSNGNHYCRIGVNYQLLSDSHFPQSNPELWKNLKFHLTDNQWKWVYCYIILDMPYKEIAIQEETTINAVKSWGKQVKKKLRDINFGEFLFTEV
ncbi:sigma-70 family RNA polymerase sigma factor [Virgibacillus doumboii]|uniref:sigma-70 family RNA polymerase sigma factor n=1 Tax=Virgibacillus doumboii TaxID=2697503 RepID=UPI0013E04432|nr:sigma-70 family RNA polymerase sigma factor [Virgibacillus doumboii]